MTTKFVTGILMLASYLAYHKLWSTTYLTHWTGQGSGPIRHIITPNIVKNHDLLQLPFCSFCSFLMLAASFCLLIKKGADGIMIIYLSILIFLHFFTSFNDFNRLSWSSQKSARMMSQCSTVIFRF